MKNVEMHNRPWDHLGSFDPRRHAVAAVAGVSAIVVVSLFVSGRGAPARIAPPASAVGGSPQATSTSAASVMVHVAGAVRFPGVYELREGTRVADAIALAGGPRPRADLDLLNLAQQITDGMKIEVSRRGAPAVPSEAGAPHASPGAPISLNAAGQIALEAIPGIGPVRAAAILAYRDEHGGFTTVEELLEVSGIGPATLEALRPYVTL